MRVNIFIGMFALLAVPIQGQIADSLDILSCLQIARQKAPLTNELNQNAQLNELKQANINAVNLPNVSAYGRASYQSDAMAVNFPPPMGINFEVNRFQYNVGINIEQKIYDGGLSKNQKEYQQAATALTNATVEQKIYGMYQQVTNLFYSNLLLIEKRRLANLKLENLQERERQMKSAHEQGMLSEVELRKMRTEILSTEQLVSDIDFQSVILRNQLKTYLGLGSDAPLILSSEMPGEPLVEQPRPEYEAFEAMQQQLESARNMQNAARLPHLSAFGQAGYSYPGLNMFENSDDYYYLVGAKLGWHIFDWKQTHRSQQMIIVQQQQVDTRRSDFDRQLLLAETRETTEIVRLQNLLATNREIISEKEKITRASATSLASGSITTADYLIDLNSELKSRIDQENYKISLQQSKLNLALIKGLSISSATNSSTKNEQP